MDSTHATAAQTPTTAGRYEAPELRELGRISAITLGNSGKKGDNQTKKK